MTRSLFLGGIIDGIVGAFSAIADWIVGGLESIYNGIVNMIQAWAMKIIYVFLKGFFLVIDFINLLFRKMCGLDSVKIDGTYIGSVSTGEFEGDLALVLIQSQQVIDVFISILVVAVILLFIFTFIAIIRNQYNATDSKTKGSNGPIIGKALKALFTFLFVPAICILGIMLSNGLLRTLDGATRLSAGTSISGQIFQTSANSANRIMTDDAFWEAFQADNGASGLNPNGTTFNYSTPPSSMTPREYAAILVNEAFAMNAICNADINATYRDGLAHMQSIDEVHYIKSFDFMNENIVWVYYDLTKFNWLIAFVACFFVGSALLVASIGIIQRLYEITLLFAISPPFVALMPIDDGKAFGGWRKKFTESVLVMYGPILAVNFFFIITPILMHIDLFYTAAEIEAYGATGCALFNDIGHLLFIICGALMIKEFSSLLTSIITGNDRADLMAKGGNMAGAMAGAAQKAMNAPYKISRAAQGWKNLLPGGKGGKGGGGRGSGGPGGPGGPGSSGPSGLRGKLGATAGAIKGGLRSASSKVRTGVSSTTGHLAGTREGKWAGKHIGKPMLKGANAVGGAVNKLGAGVRSLDRGVTDKTRGGFQKARDATSSFRDKHLTTSFRTARKMTKLQNGSMMDQMVAKQMENAKDRKDAMKIYNDYEQKKRDSSRKTEANKRDTARKESDKKFNEAKSKFKTKMHDTFVDSNKFSESKNITESNVKNRKNLKANSKGNSNPSNPGGSGSPTP